MKKTLKIAGISILSIVLLLLTMNLLVPRNIKTEIVIDAPSDEVWNILMNHKSYPDWNPFVKKISGSTAVGEKLSVTIQTEGNDPMDFTPTVLANDLNKEFRWLGKLLFKGLFDGEHYFVLEEIDPSQSKFTHGENFSGILSGLLMMMIRNDTEEGFRSMNLALKLRTERK